MIEKSEKKRKRDREKKSRRNKIVQTNLPDLKQGSKWIRLIRSGRSLRFGSDLVLDQAGSRGLSSGPVKYVNFDQQLIVVALGKKHFIIFCLNFERFGLTPQVKRLLLEYC